MYKLKFNKDGTYDAHYYEGRAYKGKVKPSKALADELNECMRNTPLALTGDEINFESWDSWVDGEGTRRYE
jgi:hypothetical protein